MPQFKPNAIPEKYFGRKGELKRIVMHWTGGANNVNQLDRKHYHFIIDREGNVHIGDHSPTANISLYDGAYAQHTKGTNERAIGVSIAGFGDFKQSPFTPGKWAGNELQVSAMVVLISRLATYHRIDINYKNVLSHAEVQPTLKIAQNGKIDFVWLPGFGLKQSINPVAMGDLIRARILSIGKVIPPKTPTPKLPPAPTPTPTPTPTPVKPTVAKLANTPIKIPTTTTTTTVTLTLTPTNQPKDTTTMDQSSSSRPNDYIQPKKPISNRPFAGRWTYMLSLFGVAASTLSGLRGANSLPEIFNILGDAVQALGFAPQNAGVTLLGFAAIGTTRMGIAKLLATLQALWPMLQEVRALAAKAKLVIDEQNKTP